MAAMKPTCPARASVSPLTPVRRQIPLPAQIVRGTPDEFDLPHGALWGMTPQPDVRIRCSRGQIWITQAGSAADVVLLTGETFAPAPKGRIVIQALTDARVSLA
jgi:hypothetical protein